MPGLDSYVKLLLHCDGADASTTFTDSSTSAHTVTANGTAQIDTAQSKFGGASGLISGTGQFLSIPDSDDFTFGTGDFTIDLWVRWSAISGSDVLYSHYGDANNRVLIYRDSSKRLIFYSKSGGTEIAYYQTAINVVTTGTWHHLAFVRSGAGEYIFVDGVAQTLTYTTNPSASTNYPNAAGSVWIGKNEAGNYLDGWIDEYRISNGIARWTEDFTPPTAAYAETLTLDENETVYLDDSWIEQLNPDNQSINDTLSLSDNWLSQINPDNQSVNDTLFLEDIWNIHISNEELDTNENLYLDDTWETLVNPEQQSISDEILLSDNWIENRVGIDVFKINTDFRWLATITRNIQSSLSWLLIKAISTDFRWLSKSSKAISTDFRWLSKPYLEIPQTPISLPNIQILINGVDVLLGNDINIQSGNIVHTIGQKSQASFILARRHDDLNRTHAGVSSQITNQNPVKIYIYGHLEFDGFISNISVNSESETVAITALMDEPADNRHSIELPLPSINEKLHLYHCLVNNVSIDNPKQDTRAVIIGNNGRYWNGLIWIFSIENALTFTTDIDAQNYIDSYVDLSVNLIFESKQPSVTSREKNPQYYNGVKVNLGTNINQRVDRYRALELITDGSGRYASQIEDGTFITKPNYTYFWSVLAKNVLTGRNNADYRYIGTSLASTTTDLWVLRGVVPMYQKIKDNIETELGYYYIGSAPYKEISCKNGALNPVHKWQDRNDGLYNVLEASYNYVDYAKLVADLEYEKLKNVHGDITPITSASLDITFDAYYFYNVKLLTRINVTNTTIANTYNNLNGFPTSVKGININFASMKIALTTDNRLSQDELDEIDEQMPDEENPLYLVPETAHMVYRKFDLKSWMYVS